MIQKKVCMLGGFSVGKTSLVARFVHSIFSDKYLTTVGVKIDKKVITAGDQEVQLMLWDMAGEDAHTAIKPMHLRGAAGYIVVVDGTRKATLDAALDIQRRVAEVLPGVPFICVVNKADIQEQWELKPEDLEALAARGWKYIKASARTGDSVEQFFQQLTQAMLLQPAGHDDQTATSASFGR